MGTQANVLAQLGSDGISTGFKNRIINGAMVIDQRNAGASVTPSSSGYTLDRWRAAISPASKFSVQQSSTAPVGFTNSLLVTTTSAYSVSGSDFEVLHQPIEGYNVSDLGWGTASAKTVTLSFWVRSSLTGTFGGALRNDDGNRAYPFTYTISSANTWEYKTVTVPGDTTGTWYTTNGVGMMVYFGLGVGSTLSGTAGTWAAANYVSATGATSVVGTNGATFYITGVQLEVGNTATDFEYRPYGTELALCQRYYQAYAEAYYNAVRANYVNGSANDSGPPYTSMILYPVKMRATPSASLNNGSASINAADDSRARIVYSSSRSPGQSEMIITTLALSAEL